MGLKTQISEGEKGLFLKKLSEERRLSPSTISIYDRELRSFLELWKSGKEAALKQHLASKSAATHQRKLVIWRSFLKFVGEDKTAILSSFSSPKLRQKEPRFLSDEEVFRLESACFRSKNGARDRLLISLGLQLGLRIQEILSLRFSDFQEGWLRIIRKGSKEQRLPLTPSIQAQLQFHRKEIQPTPQESDFVFLGSQGKALTTRGAQKILLRLAKMADLKQVHPHALRHTFATKMASNGISLAILKEFLGHSRIQTTERYLHITPQHLKDGLKFLKPSPPP